MADFEAVFANVTELRITGGFAVQSAGYDGANLDNVVLNAVPGPSVAVLLALGLVGLVGRRSAG
jgi:uncharacterized protein (TIGR03382 family)